MAYLLGVDVGTTGTKAILFSSEGKLIAGDYMSYPLRTPAVGYSEQDALDWWRAVVKTVRAVCADIDAEQVAAISLSLQGGTMVAVNADFEPIHPAIVWNDTRCKQEEKAFEKAFGRDYMYKTTGWRLGSSLNAMQIAWLKTNKPEIFEQAHMFLSVPDFIAAKMTGIPALDLSDAGINQLADIYTGTYKKEILDFIGIGSEKLGRLVKSGDVIGPLTRQAAQELGLTEKTLLVAGAHDQYAVAAGAGCLNPGDILVGSGTAWVVTALSKEAAFESGFSQSRAAANDLWGSMVSMSTGGICLEWIRNKVLGSEGGLPISYDTINASAAAVQAAANGLFFYPYFNGCTYPFINRDVRASFVGLDLSHDKSHMIRAVMEGVAFQIAWIIEGFKQKYSIEHLKLAGGASKSPLWCQILADITGIPIQVPAVADLACVGAALLAGTGSGIYKDAQEGYGKLAVTERVTMPDPKAVGTYEKAFLQYKKGAEALIRI